MKKSTIIALGAGIGLAGVIVALKKKNSGKDNKRIPESDLDLDNPYLNRFSSSEGKQGKRTIYEKIIKPVLDRMLSAVGLIVLSPVLGIIALSIVITDPGPVLFTQKRVGKDCEFFYLHKFRTMKMSAPHDVPTHQLSDPERYITSVGHILRRTSLDELPQIWDILRGKMSVIGPRPALWNQDDLVAERAKYNANSVTPGLTGLAQINGRDELEIEVKARFDGEYVRVLRKSIGSGMGMDIKCFFGTAKSVVRSDGVVEGGTGEIHRRTQ